MKSFEVGRNDRQTQYIVSDSYIQALYLVKWFCVSFSKTSLRSTWVRIHFLCKQFMEKFSCIFFRNFVMWVRTWEKVLWINKLSFALFQSTTNSKYSIKRQNGRNFSIDNCLKVWTNFFLLLSKSLFLIFTSSSNSCSPDPANNFLCLRRIKREIIERRADTCSNKRSRSWKQWRGSPFTIGRIHMFLSLSWNNTSVCIISMRTSNTMIEKVIVGLPANNLLHC